jgi:dihydroflavonol-4-reductase
VASLLARIARRFGLPAPGRRLEHAEALSLAIESEARCAPTRSRPAISREMVDVIGHGQFADSSRAQAELGYRVRPLDETLDASMSWYRRNGYVKRQAINGLNHLNEEIRA